MGKKNPLAEASNKPEKEYNFMLEILIMLAAPVAVACYYYRWRAVLIIIISVASAVLCELIGYAVMKRKSELEDLSAIVTGIMIALMMSASTPYWIPAVGSVFAILVAKLPFGGTKSSLFVPAAAGFAFLCICWPDYIFTYPSLPITAQTVSMQSEEFIKGLSLAAMLKNSNSIPFTFANVIQVLTGNVPGPMGASCPVVLLGIAGIVLVRKPKNAFVSIGFGLICAIFACVFPRVLTGRKSSLLMEISAGVLLFTGVLLLPDETTAPKGKVARLLYGAAGGLVCMLIRYFGTFEEGACFAVLIMNAFSPFFDKKYIPAFLKKSPPKEEEGGAES